MLLLIRIHVLTQTATNATGKRRGRKTKTKTANPMDYTASLFIGNDGDSSSSSDSFITEDRRSSFPIDSTRSDSVNFNFPVKTVVDTVTDDFLYRDNSQASVKQHLRLSRYLTTSSDYSSLNSGSLVRDQFSNAYDRWTTKIQEVRMNTSMYNFWNISAVYKYIWYVVQGLSIYCCLDSILAIDEPAGEVNRVNTVMKTHYNDTDLLNLQDALRRKLKNQWLPPEISNLILWTYQLYKTENNATCIQYRFIPDDGLIKTEDADDAIDRLKTEMNYVIFNLETADSTRIRSILRSSLPSGCINTIPHACNRPTYSQMHHELYANQAMIWSKSDGTERVFPILPETSSAYTVYGMRSNPAGDNGFAFALSQSFKTGSYEDNDMFNTFKHSNGANNYLDGTNEFFAEPNKFNVGSVYWQEDTLQNHSVFNETGCSHLVEINAQTGQAIVAKTTMPLGYQRVYFNSYGQRSLIAKQVFRELFSVN
uniref:Uncharacterized protein n=1 Tax=viral metagenome TaxID=1070528 RepID=A0A2V0RLK9_9ZZZZ